MLTPNTATGNLNFDSTNMEFLWSPSVAKLEENCKRLITETRSLFRLASPIAATAILLYLRSVISMAFLGRLGDAELAGGSLAIAFANISAYSVLSGLALGMEPLCSQAFGADRQNLLSLTLHRTILFLLCITLPITILWLNVSHILKSLRQDATITKIAETYLLFSLPDLLTNSFIQPIRVYLRAQGITRPLTLATLVGTILHIPFNLVLVSYLKLGVAGVAAAGMGSNVVVLISLVAYLIFSPNGLVLPLTWECVTGWVPLIKLATPSCVSVCLEWWWYEIMILLCGLLVDPRPTVASMGVLIQTTSFIYIFPSSLGLAVSTRVGNELGASRPDRAKTLAAASIALSAVMGALAMSFAWGTRDLWGRFFSTDEKIRFLTSSALPILGLCELGNAPQTVACGIIRGTARPKKAANVNLGAFYFVGMPMAVGFGFWLGLGFRGLWLGLLSAQITCASLMLYVVGCTDWDAEVEKAKALTAAEESRVSVAEERQLLVLVMVVR